MFQRFHAMKEREEGGFTLIELLVVILIIAILAAIAIPVFLNQRKKGWEAQQQSTLKDAATAAETYASGNNGDYTGLTLVVLNNAGYVTPSYATVTVPTANGTAYCVQSVHAQDPGAWKTAHFLSSDGQPKTGACP
jgi:type IV pilus assembly protein PilA